MRIITWNMGCGWRASEYRKHHDAAWSYLLDQHQPDVAFVQVPTCSGMRCSFGPSRWFRGSAHPTHVRY
jgi:hypothetical protein